MTSSASDDLRLHFFAAVGQLLDQAAVGQLDVRVELRDGTTAAGVPSRSDDRQIGELDDTGYPALVNIGHERVDLDHVRRATIVHPDCRSADGTR